MVRINLYLSRSFLCLSFIWALLLGPGNTAACRAAGPAPQGSSANIKASEDTLKMSQIESDIRTIVQGNFTPDALGPEKYDQVIKRARAQPGEYVDVFERLYLGANFDALAQSRLYLPAFLKIIADRDPERAQAAARRLLKQYDAVLLVYDEVKYKPALFDLLPEETVRMLQSLEARRAELRSLISQR
jgi:hypothetical protein